MVLFAFSLQDQVEKYGAYVGIAAFFGLAVLSLLYFAQAREVKRLREWAGRAPERAAELEQAVLEHAEEARRVPTPTPAPQPQPAVANGAVKLQPAEVAALAFARAAGVHEPHVPRPHPAPVPAAAVAAPGPPSKTADIDPAQPTPNHVAAAGAAVATGEPAAAQALAPTSNGGGSGTAPPKPPPATPAARRPEPAPLPPRRPAPPPRRQVSPPRRESNMRSVVITAVVGVLVLAGTAFVITSLLGGDDPEQAPPPVASVPPDEGEPAATAEALSKENALVMVYNGTSIGGLAGRYQDQLVQEGYPQANTDVATLSEAEQRQTSVVMFRNASARRAAEDVGSALGIDQVERLDAATQASLANLPESQQKDWNVVVIVGVDKGTS
jgi:LytR cell envelope-related transcriptional attenuator